MGFLDLMREHLDEPGDFHLAVKVASFVDKMETETPVEWADFLWEHSPLLVNHLMGKMLASDRGKAQHRRSASAFAKSHAAGVYHLRFTVDETNTKRELGEMTGADHAFVANMHTTQSRRSQRLASRHRVLARRVGNRKTRDVYSEQELVVLFNEFGPGSEDTPETAEEG